MEAGEDHQARTAIDGEMGQRRGFPEVGLKHMEQATGLAIALDFVMGLGKNFRRERFDRPLRFVADTAWQVGFEGALLVEFQLKKRPAGGQGLGQIGGHLAGPGVTPPPGDPVPGGQNAHLHPCAIELNHPAGVDCEQFGMQRPGEQVESQFADRGSDMGHGLLPELCHSIVEPGYRGIGKKVASALGTTPDGAIGSVFAAGGAVNGREEAVMTAEKWRNRVVGHARVRAGDLKPHPLNPRTHPDFQVRALRAVLDRLGWARSLLVHRLADGSLGLLDGHLRQSLDPDALVEVEIVDLDEREARELLLCLDPLGRLALTDPERAAMLRQLCPVDNPDLHALFDTVGRAEDALRALLESLGNAGQADKPPPKAVLEAKYLVVAECPSEASQRALLAELRGQGLVCRALAS